MRRMLYGVVVVVFGLLVAAIPAPAHHSFAAEFDANKCTDLTGTFTSYEWQNPHGYFHLDVKDPSGTVNSWTFETVSLSTLKRSGTQRRDFENSIGKNRHGQGVPGQEWHEESGRCRNHQAAGRPSAPNWTGRRRKV